MKKDKIKYIAYWVTTALLAVNYIFAGTMYLGQGPEVMEGSKVLGYPMYFMMILGVWKILGAIAILLPKTPVIKEWAYAGMVINLTSAAISNGISGLGTGHIITPLMVLAFVVASWWLRPEDRRLA